MRFRVIGTGAGGAVPPLRTVRVDGLTRVVARTASVVRPSAVGVATPSTAVITSPTLSTPIGGVPGKVPKMTAPDGVAVTV